MTKFDIRPATLADLPFLVRGDLLAGGDEPASLSEAEMTTHRAKLAAFVSRADHAGWVADDSGRRAGMILCRFRATPGQGADWGPEGLVFGELPATLFPADSRFCEIFQLWVEPEFRRRGLARRLKQRLEGETHARGIRLIYTHTEATNHIVRTLNEDLGYSLVRIGPIWDEIDRASYVKRL